MAVDMPPSTRMSGHLFHLSTFVHVSRHGQRARGSPGGTPTRVLGGHMKTTLLCSCAGLAAITFLGCGRADDPAPPGTESTGTEKQAIEATALPVLNTFINESLQIDQDPAGLTPEQANQSAKDANLFETADPADGTPSFNRPGGGPAAFIDWEDLAGDLANHRLLDPHAAGGKDPSSFPHSNECVGNSMVLSKMDLTYVGAANNNAWAYFAVQRSNNNGDAGYYWLFTRKEPQLLQQAPCNASERRLMYEISPGDVLLRGHFHPSTDDPLLTVYTAQKATSASTAIAAIN